MSKLIIDNREQLPLEFRPGVFDFIDTQYMPFADYWLEVDGKEVPLMMERKSLGDLYGTLFSENYERFKRELQRAKDMDCHLMLLIEGSIEDVWKGYSHSSISGDTMLKKLAMMRVRYDLEVHFFNTRREMARWIEEIFSAIVRNYTKENSETISNLGVNSTNPYIESQPSFGSKNITTNKAFGQDLFTEEFKCTCPEWFERKEKLSSLLPKLKVEFIKRLCPFCLSQNPVEMSSPSFGAAEAEGRGRDLSPERSSGGVGAPHTTTPKES